MRIARIAELLDRYSRKICELLADLAGWAVFVMMGVVVADILMVSTRLGSLIMKVELVQMLMIIVVFGSLAYADILEKHAVATIFVHRLSPKWRAVCDAVGYSIALFICIILTWQIILYAQHMTAIRKNCLSSDLPYYPFTWFSVAGFILLDVRYIIRCVATIYKVFEERRKC